LLVSGDVPCSDANLPGIPLVLVNSAARLVLSSLRYDLITPLLRQLHWLKAGEQKATEKSIIDLSSLSLCQHGAALSYLADELSQPADFEARRRLRSASSSSLIVSRTRLSTISDRAFPVAAARVWNSLPQHVTSASSLSVFRSRLKIHLFRRLAVPFSL